jgi:hypothetical protein
MSLIFRTITATTCLAAALIVVLPAGAGEIDFEGLDEGQVIDEVSNGSGATGLPNGEVSVFGFNPGKGFNRNAAIVFDSACLPGGDPEDCTGDDRDLGTPNETCPGGGPGSGEGGECPGPFQNDTPYANTAIVAEDLVDANGDDLIDDPDDADRRGQYIEFDFDELAGNHVTVNSLTYMDNDEGEFDAQVEFFGPGTLQPSVIGLTATGDNGVNTIAAGIEGVTRMRVVLNGSGAVASVVIDEEIEQRACWVTTGGFNKGEVVREDASGKKICTFGGNVGPPPSGAFEVNWHDGPLAGSKFHTNDIEAVRCEDRSETGPGQPGGKKGLLEDTLLFECTGKFNKERGYSCTGYLLDGGEPGGKKGNDPDQIQLVVNDSSGTEVARCEGILSGGNVQIHPPVGPQ